MHHKNANAKKDFFLKGICIRSRHCFLQIKTSGRYPPTEPSVWAYVMRDFFRDSWNFLPKFMASVEMPKDERMRMELPTKLEEAPRWLTLGGGFLGAGSLSDGAPPADALAVAMGTVCSGVAGCFRPGVFRSTHAGLALV